MFVLAVFGGLVVSNSAKVVDVSVVIELGDIVMIDDVDIFVIDNINDGERTIVFNVIMVFDFSNMGVVVDSLTIFSAGVDVGFMVDIGVLLSIIVVDNNGINILMLNDFMDGGFLIVVIMGSIVGDVGIMVNDFIIMVNVILMDDGGDSILILNGASIDLG